LNQRVRRAFLQRDVSHRFPSDFRIDSVP
jgi:hypothetical protein